MAPPWIFSVAAVLRNPHAAVCDLKAATDDHSRQHRQLSTAMLCDGLRDLRVLRVSRLAGVGDLDPPGNALAPDRECFVGSIDLSDPIGTLKHEEHEVRPSQSTQSHRISDLSLEPDTSSAQHGAAPDRNGRV